MTSVLPDQQKNVVRIIKQKPQNQKTSKEVRRGETRSFLNFSRENLSISNSDLEQGFNKTKFRVRRHNLISIVALVLALACIGVEIWKFKWVVDNKKDIEILKRDVDILKHRLLEEDLLDELKAFEEKLYAEEGNGDDEDTDMENVDYDSNYDDESRDYNDDYQASGLATRSSDLPHASKSTSSSNKGLEEILVALRKMEVNQCADLEKCLRDNIDKLEKEKSLNEENMNKENITTSVTLGKTNPSNFENITDAKQKRSIYGVDDYQIDSDSIYEIPSDSLPNHEHNKTGKRKHRLHQDSTKKKKKKDSNNEMDPTGLTFRDKHPPKKFFAKPGSEVIRSTTNKLHEILNDDSDFRITKKEGLGMKKSQKGLWRRAKQESVEINKMKENLEEAMTTRSLGRGLTRRHLKVPRQVFAVHYGGDSSLFSSDDEHTGNGRAKHSEGIFKAWKPSDWVEELGMSRHFILSDNGRLTVQEPGLYLAYAQIHYLDEHDENGFHMLVNGRPILQCMVYSPGTGHKSRSCFSAQVTVLQPGDHLVLKDVASARYTLFQKDKSFFGLVKLGDWRQPQKHQQHSVQP